MNTSTQETTLLQERMHWGIYLFPALFTVSFVVLMIPEFLVCHMFSSMTQSLVPGTQSLMLTIFPYFFSFVQLGTCAILFAIVKIARSKSLVTLTNRRLMFRTGVLSKTSGELPLENVEATFLHEPFLGRVFGFGTVIATGVGGIQFPLHFIGAAEQFHTALQNAVATAKRTIQLPNKMPLHNDESRYMPKS
ncbi:MAG TPA: PH domain-containing protein [Verrucomicrobiae bacterium]|jgi:uncharacterized membrane protein YdbT with pleckstrin-like domain